MAESGVIILGGLYRVEFSYDPDNAAGGLRSNKPAAGGRKESPAVIEAWISWVDPGTKDPDFHVPASLGWFEFRE